MSISFSVQLDLPLLLQTEPTGWLSASALRVVGALNEGSAPWLSSKATTLAITGGVRLKEFSLGEFPSLKNGWLNPGGDWKYWVGGGRPKSAHSWQQKSVFKLQHYWGDGVHPLDYTVEPMVGIAVDPLCVFFPWFNKVVQVSLGGKKKSSPLTLFLGWERIPWLPKRPLGWNLMHSIPKDGFPGEEKT